LPYLIIGGKKAAEEAGRKMGSGAWVKAKALWGKLSPKMMSEAEEAARDVAASPDDLDSRAALCEQLKEILAEDSHLTEEVGLLVTARQKVGELHGKATAIEIEEITRGAVEAEQDIDAVAGGGEAIAAKIGKLGGGKVKADQNVDEVEEGGSVTGVKIEKM
jgi:hypothetical protein